MPSLRSVTRPVRCFLEYLSGMSSRPSIWGYISGLRVDQTYTRALKARSSIQVPTDPEEEIVKVQALPGSGVTIRLDVTAIGLSRAG